MEYLVFLMPLLGTLPLAVAAVVIARWWFRHRLLRGELAEQLAELHTAVESLQSATIDLQERLDFAERLLTQLKDGEAIRPAIRPAD